jgi:putative hydrolase of the HAD superfamily
MTKGLIFDLDDTLYDATLAYGVALKAIGCTPEDVDFCNARTQVKNRLPLGHVSARNRVLYFKEMLTLKADYSPQKVLSLMETYEEALSKEVTRQWKELQRRDLFLEISTRFKYILLTNENVRTQLVKLRAIDPHAEFFKDVLISEEFGVEKPNLNLFLEACKRLGYEPQDCAMVGDNLAADILPAHSLGIKTFWTQEFLKDSPGRIPPEGTVVLNKLTALKEHLK